MKLIICWANWMTFQSSSSTTDFWIAARSLSSVSEPGVSMSCENTFFAMPGHEHLLADDAVQVAVGQAVALPDERERLRAGRGSACRP